MAEREWISKDHKIFRMPNGKVYARPNVHGLGRKEFSLGRKIEGDLRDLDSKTLRSLISAKDRKVAELLKKNEKLPASLYRFERLAEEVMKEKRGGKAAKTAESAELHLEKHLIPWVNQVAPYLYEWEEKGETLWQQYVDFKRRLRPKIKFFNHKKHLGMVLLRAFERGIIKRKVVLYNPDPKTDIGRVLSRDEVRRLYREASQSLKTQILMAFTMGLRKSEILKLDWNRVDFTNRELVFFKQNTKTRKPRVVPMNDYVDASLQERFTERDSLWVFPSRYLKSEPQQSNKTAWKAAKRRAGVTARFHDLRHTFITNAVRAGMNPVLICKYAGVSQDVMSEVYCHLDTTDLKLLAGSFGEKMGEQLK